MSLFDLAAALLFLVAGASGVMMAHAHFPDLDGFRAFAVWWGAGFAGQLSVVPVLLFAERAVVWVHKHVA